MVLQINFHPIPYIFKCRTSILRNFFKVKKIFEVSTFGSKVNCYYKSDLRSFRHTNLVQFFVART